MNPSRVRSLIEGKSSEFLLQALPFRGLFGLAKLTGEFEKLLRPLGFSDACSTSRESIVTVAPLLERISVRVR